MKKRNEMIQQEMRITEDNTLSLPVGSSEIIVAKRGNSTIISALGTNVNLENFLFNIYYVNTNKERVIFVDGLKPGRYLIGTNIIKRIEGK